jgi:hypothetical protein
MDVLEIGLRRRLGEAVQPVDLIVGGSAIAAYNHFNDAYWHVGASDTAYANLERWGATPDLAVRVAVKVESTADHAPVAVLAAQEAGKHDWFGAENRRVRQIAHWALTKGGLTVREFDPTVFAENDVDDVMSQVRRNAYSGPDVIPGRTLRLNGKKARVTTEPLDAKDPSIWIGNGIGDMRFLENLSYTAPGVRVTDMSLEFLDATDEDTPSFRPTETGLTLIHQHAVHTRIHELKIITGALARASEVLADGRRLRSTGRMMDKPAQVVLTSS